MQIVEEQAVLGAGAVEFSTRRPQRLDALFHSRAKQVNARGGWRNGPHANGGTAAAHAPRRPCPWRPPCATGRSTASARLQTPRCCAQSGSSSPVVAATTSAPPAVVASPVGLCTLQEVSDCACPRTLSSCWSAVPYCKHGTTTWVSKCSSCNYTAPTTPALQARVRGSLNLRRHDVAPATPTACSRAASSCVSSLAHLASADPSRTQPAATGDQVPAISSRHAILRPDPNPPHPCAAPCPPQRRGRRSPGRPGGWQTTRSP